MKTFFVYELGPIDYWGSFMSIDDYLKITHDEFGNDATGHDYLKNLLEEALEATRHAGTFWEGDFRQGPYVLGIPCVDSYSVDYIFGWKQDNNGQSYIVSPYPLFWIDEPYKEVRKWDVKSLERKENV